MRNEMINVDKPYTSVAPMLLVGGNSKVATAEATSRIETYSEKKIDTFILK